MDELINYKAHLHGLPYLKYHHLIQSPESSELIDNISDNDVIYYSDEDIDDIDNEHDYDDYDDTDDTNDTNDDEFINDLLTNISDISIKNPNYHEAFYYKSNPKILSELTNLPIRQLHQHQHNQQDHINNDINDFNPNTPSTISDENHDYSSIDENLKKYIKENIKKHIKLYHKPERKHQHKYHNYPKHLNHPKHHNYPKFRKSPTYNKINKNDPPIITPSTSEINQSENSPSLSPSLSPPSSLDVEVSSINSLPNIKSSSFVLPIFNTPKSEKILFNPSLDDLKIMDNKFKAIQELINAKKKLLASKQKKVKQFKKGNEYLDIIKDDYSTYNNFIEKLKYDQINALQLINQYIKDLVQTEKLTQSNLQDAKVEQNAILNEIEKIRNSLKHVIGETKEVNELLYNKLK